MKRIISILAFGLAALAQGAVACSLAGTSFPIEYSDAPSCAFEHNLTFGAPVVDLGNGRILQTLTVGAATSACRSAYKIAVYDCRTNYVGNIPVFDDEELYFGKTAPKFDFKRWSDADFQPTIMQSALGVRFKRLAKRNLRGFIRGVEWTRPHARISEFDAASIPPEMQCACGHFYPKADQ